MIKHALKTSRRQDFAAWYQEVIAEADLAEESGVRGCMVIRPWGFGIWERIQALLDKEIKATGHENCYFPLFIPLSYFEKEAQHVDGFAKEMAVVTHHRLIEQDGRLIPDPDARLEEPLIIRPTSETVIGAAFSRWIQSWRDLPVLINQWANVVRWEMRTRMFLRTTEFLWQEGHTAHATQSEAVGETLKILELYRRFAEEALALPVVAGEKPEHERFPGAVATYSIEAMMQDGKALQAGTSHYLGTNFAAAQDIRYQSKDGGHELAHTTSWGVTTRLVGAVVMVHGDDDGLRVPPRIAPYQIVVVPMLRDDGNDDALLDYCSELVDRLRSEKALGELVRVHLDKRPTKAGPKRWGWIKKGAPIIIEVGARDMAVGLVTVIRRDGLYGDDGKLAPAVFGLDDFVNAAPGLLEDIQLLLHRAARERLDVNIRRDVTDMAALEAHFGDGDSYPGWVELAWSRPSGAALAAVVERLKAMKVTIRNVPEAGPVDGACFFTGEPAVERILVARAY